MRYIGDVHGKFNRYLNIIKDCKESIQVGDMGVGFINTTLDGETYLTNAPVRAMTNNSNHRFIRGNHDNPNVCRMNKQWIHDGAVENDIMFVGGAYSIDLEYRTLGINYWDDEELSSNEMKMMIDYYSKVKPRVMITHECPESVSAELFPRRLNIPSRTREMFEVMKDCHSPELWIFGHWHMSRDKVISRTRYICLDELEYMDID